MLSQILHEGIWDIILRFDERQRANVELTTKLKGYLLRIDCREITHRSNAHVTYEVITPNGMRMHPLHARHFYNSDELMTVVSSAAKHVEDVKIKLERDPAYFLSHPYKN